MHGASEEFAESYRAEPTAVPAARAALTRFAQRAGVDGPRLDDVRLAVSEAVTNAVRHAYAQAAGPIRVRAVADREWLLVTVADDGRGLDVAARRGGRARAGLGVGLGLIARVCDQLTVVLRREGGTELRLRFDLPRPGGAR